MAAPTIVQSASGGGHSSQPTVTLGSAPTPGNLLICLCGMAANGTAALDTSNYTLIDSLFSTDQTALLFYRVVQSGDTVNCPNMMSSAVTDCCTAVYEVAGTTGPFSGVLDQKQLNGSVAATTITSSGITTGSANTLVLTFASNQIFFGSGPNVNGTFTRETPPSNLNNAYASAHDTVVSSGTTITPTWTWAGTPSSHNVMGIISLKAGSSGETAVITTRLSGISQAVNVSVGHPGAITTRLAGISQVLTGTRSSSAHAVTALSGISQKFNAYVAKAAGTGRRQFWTS